MTLKNLIVALILVFWGLPILSWSQPSIFTVQKVDSLQKRIRTEPDGSAKISDFDHLASMYLLVNPNLTLQYAHQGAELARKWKDFHGLIACLGQSAFCYALMGEWAKASRDVYEALPLCEKFEPTQVIYMCNIMVVVSTTKGDDRESLGWAQKGLGLINRFHPPEESTWPTYMQICMLNGYLKNVDSASFYGEKVKYLIKKYGSINPLLLQDSYSALGGIAFLKNQYPEAIQYFKLGKDYIRVADVFQILKNSDSTQFYGLKALHDATHQKFSFRYLKANKLLADEYSTKNPALAIFYLNQYISAKDSLNTNQKAKELEQIKLDQQRANYTFLAKEEENKNRFFFILLGVVLASLALALGLIYRSSRFKAKANKALEESYTKLQLTQSQLIQSEKMASLGELTAGIAHEIQNPLNFVNNFSQLNLELLEDLDQELRSGMVSEAVSLSASLKENEEKIHFHGKRADAIVRGMLLHSRKSSGIKEPTDLNSLVKEMVNLAIKSFTLKYPNFKVDTVQELAANLEPSNISPQEIGRVMVNILENAFYSLREKKKELGESFRPLVTVLTREIQPPKGKAVEIQIRDNGSGIEPSLVDKIMQPFFTTKPTGEGTGLGLSLSYDIIKAHGGTLKVDSVLGEYTVFTMELLY